MADLTSFLPEMIGTPAINADTVRKMTKVLNTANKSVFKLKTAHGEQGTGSLYEIHDTFNTTRFLIMTCNHVLPSNSINEIIEAKLEFEDIGPMKTFSLKREYLKHIWTNKNLDATLIEISSDSANLFRSYGALFLKVGNNIVSKVEVAMLQYPQGILSIAHGDIGSVDGHFVFYQIGTASGSSGSPLLDLDCNALAMHNAGKPGSAVENPETWRRASVLIAVVKAYLQERPQADPEVLQLNQLNESLQKMKQTLDNVNIEKASLKAMVEEKAKAARELHLDLQKIKEEFKKLEDQNKSLLVELETLRQKQGLATSQSQPVLLSQLSSGATTGTSTDRTQPQLQQSTTTPRKRWC